MDKLFLLIIFLVTLALTIQFIRIWTLFKHVRNLEQQNRYLQFKLNLYIHTLDVAVQSLSLDSLEDREDIANQTLALMEEIQNTKL